jgi:hypothetical protein
VGHFSTRPHRPYDEAETLDDVRDGLHIVRTLLKMGRDQEVYDAYRGDDISLDEVERIAI